MRSTVVPFLVLITAGCDLAFATDCFTEREECDKAAKTYQQCVTDNPVGALIGKCDKEFERRETVCRNAEELCRKELKSRRSKSSLRTLDKDRNA